DRRDLRERRAAEDRLAGGEPAARPQGQPGRDGGRPGRGGGKPDPLRDQPGGEALLGQDLGEVLGGFFPDPQARPAARPAASGLAGSSITRAPRALMIRTLPGRTGVYAAAIAVGAALLALPATSLAAQPAVTIKAEGNPFTGGLAFDPSQV